MSSKLCFLLALLPLASCAGRVEHSVADAPDGSVATHRSCASGLPGADGACGPAHDIDCCGSSHVPGGSFHQFNAPDYPATVSGFELDLLEVTVGRFRAFVEAYPASKPKPGDGAHPRIAGSGWRAEWDAALPASRDELRSWLRVDPFGHPCTMWSDAPAGHEDVPMGCLSWALGFAFCAWDGGRLPTLAEWNFSVACGDEQRENPWGPEPYDETRAVYGGRPGGELIPAGSKPARRGCWGQYDLGGSRMEYVLDFIDEHNERCAPAVPCVDCADLLAEQAKRRVLRDINYNNASSSVVEGACFVRWPDFQSKPVGVRCAYDW